MNKIIKYILADFRKDKILKTILAKGKIPKYSPNSGKKYKHQIILKTKSSYNPQTGKILNRTVRLRVYVGTVCWHGNIIYPEQVFNRKGDELTRVH
jgi:hypothetical protein